MRRSTAYGGVGKPLGVIIDVDDEFAYNHSIRPSCDSSVSFQTSIDQKSRHETLVHSTHIAAGRPHILRTCPNSYFPVDRCHGQPPIGRMQLKPTTAMGGIVTRARSNQQRASRSAGCGYEALIGIQAGSSHMYSS